jgi:hypothetical protein
MDRKRDAALEALDILVGDWDLEATWPEGEHDPARGRATFEWHPSGAHLLHHQSLDLAAVPDSFSIIGCDGAADGYAQLYSDDLGDCRIYEMRIDRAVWRLWRIGDPLSRRFAGRFSEDRNTITGRWEAEVEDYGYYRTDFDLVYRRVLTGETR